MSRVYTIQYLRALAALAVVTLHASKRVHDSLPEAMTSVFSLGHAGVDLFFVISGFIMWSISRGKAQDPVGFLLRRAIRVVPPYWIAILVWVAITSILNYDWITVTPSHVLQSMAFIPHFSPTFSERIWPVLVPGWTLNYEMFFYLIFAGVLLVRPQQRMMTLCVLLCGFVAVGAFLMPSQAWAITYSSPLLLEFLGGCLVAELWKQWPGSVGRNIVLLVLGCALFAYFGPGVDDTDLLQRAVFFGGPALLITAGAVGLSAHIPHIPWLERLGDASYAIYLFHLFLLVPLGEIWIRIPQLHTPFTALGFILCSLILICLMGLSLYRYVEQPLQKLLTTLFLTRRRDPSLANR